MGRLIDADELLTHIEDYGEGQYRLDLIAPYYVRNAPTVEAIPKDQYEARLKADMVAVLDKIRAEIEEHCGLAKENHCRYCSYCNILMGIREILEIIDKRKGESEDKE